MSTNELATMKAGDLRKRALAAGATAEAVDEAYEQDDPKPQLIALITDLEPQQQRRQQHAEELRRRAQDDELRKRAEADAIVAADDKATAEAKEWRRLPLFMGSRRSLLDSDLLEVLRTSVVPRGGIRYDTKSMSNVAKAARDALEEDPYNILLICGLGRIYLKDGLWEKGGNVLLRGWKRASDIEDALERFFFLVKLCEASNKTARFKQALAVLNDIGEVPDSVTKDEAQAFLILSCHVYSKNGDVQRALATFQKCIEKEEFKYAVRVWALCALELKVCGAYEAAKTTMDGLAGVGQGDNPLEVGREMARSDLSMLEHYIEVNKDNHKKRRPPRPGEIPKEAIIGAVVFVLIVFGMLLHWLESRSLAGLGMTVGKR